MRFYDKKSLLTDYTQSLSVLGAFKKPSVLLLRKKLGDAIVGSFFIGLLKEFLEFVPNNLSADAIALYANKIMHDFENWTTDDIILCLKNGMDGKYGPVDYQFKFSSHFKKWADRYNQEIENIFYNKHLEAKNRSSDDILTKIPKEILAKFKKSDFIDDNKRKNLDIKIPDSIIAKGLKAVDEWISQNTLNK